MSDTLKFALLLGALFSGAALAIVLIECFYSRAARQKRSDELERWQVRWSQYRQWLAEFPDIALVLDNMAAEARGAQLDACHPPGPDGPWPVDGLRYVLRARQSESQRR